VAICADANGRADYLAVGAISMQVSSSTSLPCRRSIMAHAGDDVVARLKCVSDTMRPQEMVWPLGSEGHRLDGPLRPVRTRVALLRRVLGRPGGGRASGGGGATQLPLPSLPPRPTGGITSDDPIST